MFRNRILYLMILLEIMLLCILYRAYHPVFLCYAALVFPFFLVLQLIISAHFVAVVFPQERIIVTRDSGEEIFLTVRKNGFFPTGAMQIKGNIDGQKYAINVYLRGKCQGKISFPIDCSKYGIYKIKTDKVFLYDIMRLFHKKLYTNKEISVIVVPKVYPVTTQWDYNEQLYEQESDRYSEKEPGDDPSQIFDIRDYQEGDRLSRIHWKISMKLNRVMVKEYSRPLPDGVDFYIDIEHGESCMDVLFSLGLYFLEQGLVVRINGEETKETDVFAVTFMSCASKRPVSPPVYTKGRMLICCFDRKREEYEALFREDANGQICFLTDYKIYDDVVESMGVRLVDMSQTDVLPAMERVLNE